MTRVLFVGHHMTAGYEYTREALLGDDVDLKNSIECCRCRVEDVHDTIRDADVVVPLMTRLTAQVCRSWDQDRVV